MAKTTRVGGGPSVVCAAAWPSERARCAPAASSAKTTAPASAGRRKARPGGHPVTASSAERPIKVGLTDGAPLLAGDQAPHRPLPT